MNNGSSVSNTPHHGNRAGRPSTAMGDASSIKSSLGKRSMGQRATSTPAAPKTPVQKKPRHSTIVRDTVLTMMDSWFLEENENLSETLQEQEVGYNKIIANMHAQQTIAEERERVLATQLMQYRRFCMMVQNWCPQAREMFPGDMEQMLAIHEEQNRELSAFIEMMTEATDTEDEQ